jgi:periplasmic divalent cation tolerance protein
VVAGSMDYLAWITEQTEPGERDDAVEDPAED